MIRSARLFSWLALLAGLIHAPAVLAATCTSNPGARNWNTAASWNCGHVPATGDSVIVPNGSTVTLNIDTNRLASLQIDSGGTITLAGTAGFDVYLGGDLVNNGTLNFTASTGTNTIYLAGANVTSTFSGSGTWLLDNLDLNGNVIACTGACKVELAGSPNLQFSSATLFSALSGTNTFNALGNSTATLTLSRAGTQTIATTGVTYPNLVLAGSNTKTPSAGTLNILGDLTVSNGTTFRGTSNNPTVNVGGDFSNNGTFNSGTGTFTFNGTAAQAIGGTVASTFANLRINKSSGDVTITSASAALSPTVSGTLTLTSGHVITTIGTNDIGIGTAGTIAGGSAASYVQGAIQKNYAAAGTLTFPVGDAANYTPVVIAGTAGFTAGSLTVSTTGGGDHPSIASSGIDASKSVNRYWTLTSTGLPAASTYNATFNYINGTPVDYDVGATPANFIVQQWNGTNWFPTTLNGACTATPATNLCEQINGERDFGDFAIGQSLAGFNANPGAFNAFETTASTTQILGRILTKVVGASFTLSIVAVSNNARNAAPATTALTVDVIDASPTGGTLTAATNCRTTWTSVIQTQTVAAAVGWTSGRVNVTIAAPSKAVREARIRVTQGALQGCSTDNFAIRPTAFTGLGSVGASNTASTGAPFLKTGANFDLTVNSVVGYDGTPAIDNTVVVGSPNAGTIGGTFSAAAVATGVATGASFFYSEVGNFSLGIDGIYDSSFTAVDQPNDCTNDFSNTLVGGEYGCNFGNSAATATFGRFTPDNFAVSFNTPQFTTACATGSFGYVGQPFVYATAPVMTVSARNGTNNGLTNATTTNYAGAYMKFSNAAGTSFNQAPYNTQGGRYSRFDALGGGTTPALDTTGLPATTADPAIGAFAAGVGLLTFGSGTGLAFARTTPKAPFDADVALALNVVDTDGVAYAANPATIGVATAGNGVAFSSGKEQRFGRLRLQNANGSQLIAMPIPMQTQYWTGNGFVTNAADNCTTIAVGNIVIGNAQPAGFTLVSPPVVGGTFVAGIGSLRLPKSTGGARGSVDVAVNLTAGTAGASCTAGMPASTGSGLTWLQGLWCSPPGTYTKDATARATFGTFRSTDQFIYQQENY